jgi:hypothetical protein
MFHLRKWYLDCTAPDGEVMILYHATLRWNLVRMKWGGLLHKKEPSARPLQQSTLRPGPEPERHSGRILAANESLDVVGEWTLETPPHDRVLLERDDGHVRWCCCAPGASCRVRIAGRCIEGRGYGELLEMNMPPWKLPIRELRWGRWLDDHSSIVWIDWRGERPLSLLLSNGVEVPGAVEDDRVSVDGGPTLRLDRSGFLRDGELGATVLRGLPVLGGRIPPAIARTRETKWLSRGVCSNGAVGWAVHERVCFGS